ncbi:unnamed protein product [Alopecurus aequalis]
MSSPPPFLVDDLVEEVLLRLPPDDPACLVRASAACKLWRRILAAPRFRRRYRQFHGTPPVLGLFHKDGRFAPTASLPRALPDRPHWRALDCRHGRALFVTYTGYPAPVSPLDLAVLDPLTGRQRRVPLPFVGELSFSAGVLCATKGCGHHGWAFPRGRRGHQSGAKPHIRDALYFNVDGGIIKCKLGTLCLTVFDKPIDGNGALMKTEDGKMGFAAVVDVTNLAMWSRETGPEGDMEWAKLRVIDLKKLLPDGPKMVGWHSLLWWIPTGKSQGAYLSGFAVGTRVIFVSTDAGFYMVDLKSRRTRKVSCDSRGKTCFPYTNFYIPAMEAGLRARGDGLMFDVFGKFKLL